MKQGPIQGFITMIGLLMPLIAIYCTVFPRSFQGMIFSTSSFRPFRCASVSPLRTSALLAIVLTCLGL